MIKNKKVTEQELALQGWSHCLSRVVDLDFRNKLILSELPGFEPEDHPIRIVTPFYEVKNFDPRKLIKGDTLNLYYKQQYSLEPYLKKGSLEFRQYKHEFRDGANANLVKGNK